MKDGPHGRCWTRADEVNHALLGFLAEPAPVPEPPGLPASLTVMDVLRAGPDAEKGAMIVKRVRAVWER